MVLSPNVCYVCGGAGGVQTVHVRPFNKSPYFPFLESHEPPKGAHPPSKEGTVDSCNICFMFLHQQWDSYEKSRTPIMKRLYWLKRVDNRPFTGAEMRMQGEYAAQMMGLQYYPSNTGTMSPYDYSPVDSGKQKKASKPSSTNTSQTANESITDMADETGVSSSALDLSTSRDESDIRDRSINETFVCYTCETEHALNGSHIVHDQYIKEGEPFFPFLMTLKQNSREEGNRGYRVCKSCHCALHDQWKYYTVKQVPLQQRVYSFSRETALSRRSAESPRTETNSPVQFNVCYLCGQSYNRTTMKMLHTRPPLVKNSKHSIYFPFVGELRRPENAQPIDQYGRVVSCRACYSYLQRQWQAYQQDNVAVDQRKFVLRPLTDPDSSHASYASSQSPDETQSSSYLDDSARSDEVSRDMNPLNIQISATSKSGSRANHLQGLLAIAPHAPSQMLLPSSYPGLVYGAYPSSAIKQEVLTDETTEEKSDDRDEDRSKAVAHYGVNPIKEEITEEPYDLNQSTDREEEIDVGENNINKDKFFQVAGGKEANSQQGDDGSEERREDATADPHTESASPGLAQSGKPGAALNGMSATTRTTATVPPLTAPSPVNPSNAAAGRQQSGFAAALRKLAKQAEGPENAPIDPGLEAAENTSPRDAVTAGVTKRPPVTALPKLPGETSAPPVGTIAPTLAKNSYVTADRNNSAERVNSVMLDPLGIKPERDKMTPSHERAPPRDDERPRSKDSVAARLTPHNSLPTVSSASSNHEDASRGFQPYRPGEDPLRHATGSLPLTSLDAYTAYLAQHAQAAATYPGSNPYATGHHAIRMDDPLLLERYRLMQSTALAAGYPYSHPGLMAHPALSYMDPRTAPRYPAEMLAQLGYSPYLHPAAKLHDLSPGSAERLKSEEEQRRLEREREDREREREKERERERERREKEEKERAAAAAERERLEREKERQKEAERRLSSSSGSSIFSAERLLGPTAGAPGLYPPSMSEPLNLKRYDDPAARHLHLNGEPRASAADERAQLAAAAAYRSSVESSRVSTHPSLSVPPLSVPKPPGLSSHDAMPSFHRPFEAPATNGYDRNLTEYERLVKEREKMIAEHRLSQEKASQQKIAESRGRTNERIPSSGEREHRHDMSKAHINDSHRLHGDPKSAHMSNSIPTTHSSHTRRPIAHNSSPAGKSTSIYSSQTDRHTPVKSQQDNKPILHHPASLPTTQSALSSLQNFSHSSPAITSLSNMINSEHMLGRYDLDKVKQDLDKVKDTAVPANMRINGAHASTHHRMRLQPEMSDSKKRQRLNSGENHASAASLNLKPKASPKHKQNKPPVNLFSPHDHRGSKRDVSYEPPAKRLHVSGDLDYAPYGDSKVASVDDLNRASDYRMKVGFLATLQLEPVPSERRKENEFMQRVCAWDQDRRVKARLFPPPPCTVDTISKPYEYSTARMSQFISAYSSPLKRKHSPSLSNTNQQTHQSSSSTHRSHDHSNTQSASVIASTSGAPSSSGVSPLAGGASSAAQAVSAQFVHEFHESVLQQTRQQRLKKNSSSNSHQQQHSAEVRYSLISDPPETQSTSKSTTHTSSQATKHSSNHTNSLLPSSLQSMQQMTSQLVPGSTSAHKPVTSQQHQPRPMSSTQSVTSEVGGETRESAGEFKWPGMDVVMMAYHKHLEESHTEKQILREQYEVLEQQHRSLSRTAETLSKRMEELLQNKQKHEEERSRHQSKLDSLRRRLSALP